MAYFQEDKSVTMTRSSRNPWSDRLCLLLCCLLGVGPSAIATAAPLQADLTQVELAPVAPSWLVSQTPATSARVCSAQLPSAIAQILEADSETSQAVNRSQKQRSRWGILIQTLATKGQPATTLYAQDAERYFIPASNAKLLITAAALYKLTPNFQIQTSVYQTQRLADAVDLRVVGRGDPSLSDRELGQLAQQLQRQGIQRVAQLVGDDSYFQGPTPSPQWEWGDIQAGYGAPVNSLIVNQNAIGFQLWPQALGQPLRVQWDDPAEASRWRIENRSLTVASDTEEFVEVGRDLRQPILTVQGQLRVGSAPEPTSVAILDPSQNFLRRFQKALAAQQIQVTKTALTTTPLLAAQPELAKIQSPPLSVLLLEANQESNNLYAEAILRSLGAQAETLMSQPTALAGLETTSDRGLAVVKAALTELGVDPTSYVLADGSGLSRHNLVSPEALVQTLQVMAQRPEAAVYRASLSVAGVNGTLKNRLQDTPAQGRLQAKSGTLNGVLALSGYLQPPQYSPLVISLMVNQADQPLSVFRQKIDSIILLLTRLQAC